MFSKEFFELLTEVLKSWQVIAITIVLIVYLYIVSYVTRSHHRPMAANKVKVSKKESPASVAAAGPEETESSADSNDELGLEEA